MYDRLPSCHRTGTFSGGRYRQWTGCSKVLDDGPEVGVAVLWGVITAGDDELTDVRSTCPRRPRALSEHGWRELRVDRASPSLAREQLCSSSSSSPMQTHIGNQRSRQGRLLLDHHPLTVEVERGGLNGRWCSARSTKPPARRGELGPRGWNGSGVRTTSEWRPGSSLAPTMTGTG